MLLLGSKRTTSDVDILVSASEDIPSLVRLLTDQHGFSNVEGELCFDDSGIVTVDILTTAVETVTLENLGHNLLSVSGIRIPNLEQALAMKIKCFYHVLKRTSPTFNMKDPYWQYAFIRIAFSDSFRVPDEGSLCLLRYSY